jgi:hypothetical protein
MLNRLHKAAHMEEVNWALWSDVMTAGTPNLLTHAVYCYGGGDRDRFGHGIINYIDTKANVVM